MIKYTVENIWGRRFLLPIYHKGKLMTKIKNDMYRKKRGGTSKLLAIFCLNCGQYLFMYQKDGDGKLLRLYLDRITNSNNDVNISQSSLRCPHCGNLIGLRYIYKPENRPAYRLIRGTYKKMGE